MMYTLRVSDSLYKIMYELAKSNEMTINDFAQKAVETVLSSNTVSLMFDLSANNEVDRFYRTRRVNIYVSDIIHRRILTLERVYGVALDVLISDHINQFESIMSLVDYD